MAEIGIGMLGYAFMGKAHSNAFHKLAYMTWPPPLVPKLVGIAGRNAEAVEQAATRYGYEYATDDWRRLVEDDRIDLFDNGGPNALHAEPASTSSARSRSGGTPARATRSGSRSPPPASSTCARSTTASCRRSGSPES